MELRRLFLGILAGRGGGMVDSNPNLRIQQTWLWLDPRYDMTQNAASAVVMHALRVQRSSCFVLHSGTWK